MKVSLSLRKNVNKQVICDPYYVFPGSPSFLFFLVYCIMVKVETQQFVSELQAYNRMLQSAPGLIFTLVAGPFTDTWGRRPLILSALLGHLGLNLILLVNAVWFIELKVKQR